MRDSNAKMRAAHRLLEAATRMASKLDKLHTTYQFSNRIDEIRLCEGNAEPGYDDDIVALGNWNVIDTYDRSMQKRVDLIGGNLPERLSDAFEKIGVSIEWGDEWCTCDNCGKAVRTSPDSYGWKAAYTAVNDCEVYCSECTLQEPEEYLESIEGDYNKACTLDVDLAAYDYVKVSGTFENGLHHGQADSPKLIAKALERMGINRYLFSIDDVGQFDARFSAWVHVDESELFTSFDQKSIEESPSPAERCERMLRGASEAMKKLDGQ